MALFFRNPILARFEDILWDKAKHRYVDEGGNPFNDVRELSEEAQAKVNGWVTAWRSDEPQKLKLARGEYKRIAENCVAKALKSVIDTSEEGWYSIEVKESIYPVVLAVPLAILRYKTREILPPLLQEPIQLQNLSQESIAALADVA